jgi:predicted phage baseplate assembly protein
MSTPWWTLDASEEVRDAGVSPGLAPVTWPMLAPSDRATVYKGVIARAPSYTSEWTNRAANDAGVALTHLFSEEMEPVLQRVNQLPQNSFIEFLRIGGIEAFPPTPAEALLQFTVSDSATQSILIPEGFQVAATPAGGGNQVIFEIEDNLYAAPGKIQEIYVHERGFYRPVTVPVAGTPFQPFGNSPGAGTAFLIGLAAAAGAAVGPQISIAIQVQGAATLPPVATGGVVPLPTPLAPLLKWDVLNGGQYQEATVFSDETNGLVQGGVITLTLPDAWNPGIPAGAPDTSPLLWLRLQIVYGAYPVPPTLTDVQLNVVRATAVQTIWGEVLTPVPGTKGSVMALSQTPVLPSSLILQVDDTNDIALNPASLTSSSNSAANATISTSAIWTEVDDLAEFGPVAQIYTLDAGSGEVTFGDGVHGMAVPQGFRNVVALRYQVGGGSGGAVAAGAITGMVTSIPLVTGVNNPWPATGGTDQETQTQAMERGPKEIRARGRAVALADYEVLALHAPGALVARVFAVPGLHPAFAGTPIPGVVGVFVIPVERGSGPPTPDEDSLRAVSTYLSGLIAPAGVEIVAAAPVYHYVKVELSVVIADTVSRGDTVNAIIALLNAYLDPVTGGDDGQGWPFGGTLSNTAFIRKILTGISGVSAVPSLRFIVDGVNGARCTDFPIPINSLVWPLQHNIFVLGPGEEP